MASEFELPQKLVAIHPVFHIIMLKNCMGLIIPTDINGMKDNLSYEEIPVQILDRQVQNLRSKEVASVSVLGVTNLLSKLIWKLRRILRRYIHISSNLVKF